MLPLFSTAYMPSVLYLAYLARYEEVLIEQYETFPKQTFRNRANIATGNSIQTLSVPVIRPQGNHTRTDEMVISYKEAWNIQHWRAIVSAYNASPYFLYYRNELEKILMHPYERLLDLNDDLLHFLLKSFKIDCKIHYTEDYTPASPELTDYRSTLTSKKPLLNIALPPYYQVFDSRYGFQANLSAIDLLFNLGPEAKDYLKKLPITI